MVFARYRVDTIPSHLKGLLHLYGVTGAAGFGTVINTMRLVTHWEFQGPEESSSSSPRRYKGPCIHCTWHENVLAYFGYYFPPDGKHLWMQHPAAYMAPIHTFIKWNGVDSVLGSSGHGGQQALEELIAQLKTGRYSTFMAPDGPSGPVKQLKSGVVDMALATGLPIVPIRFKFESSLRLGWDQKHVPSPFSNVIVQEMAPIQVDYKYQDREEIIQTIQQALGN